MSGTVTSIKPDNDLRNRVMAPAESRKRKPHWILCEAIREYVEKEEKQQPMWSPLNATSSIYQTGNRGYTTLVSFLSEKDTTAAVAAIRTIRQALHILRQHP